MTVRPANAGKGKCRRTVLRNAAIAVAFTALLLGQSTGRPDATAPAAAPSPWTNYNAGVQAYAWHDYADARQRWQDLSSNPCHAACDARCGFSWATWNSVSANRSKRTRRSRRPSSGGGVARIIASC